MSESDTLPLVHQLSIYSGGTAFGGDTAGSGGTLDFGVGSYNTKYWQFR